MLTVISRKLIIRRNYKCIIRVLNNEKSRYSLLRQPLCCSAGDGIRQKSSVSGDGLSFAFCFINSYSAFEPGCAGER